MKTKVITNSPDGQYNEFKKDEVGYIDGYIRGGDDRPYAVVIIGERIVLVNTYQLTVIPSSSKLKGI